MGRGRRETDGERQRRGDTGRTARQGREVWASLVAEWEASGLTRGEFCSEQGINPATLTWWKWRLSSPRRGSRRVGTSGTRPGRRAVALAAPSRSEPAFLPVRVIASTTTGAEAASSHGSGAAQGFEVLLAGGRRVRVPHDFEETALQRLVLALEGLPC